VAKVTHHPLRCSRKRLLPVVPRPRLSTSRGYPAQPTQQTSQWLTCERTTNSSSSFSRVKATHSITPHDASMLQLMRSRRNCTGLNSLPEDDNFESLTTNFS
jgi:hypothetical protein